MAALEASQVNQRSRGRRLNALQVQFQFLDQLRTSGITNMFGARPYLQEAFPSLKKDEAASVLSSWMKSFDGERSARERAIEVIDAAKPSAT